MTARDPFARRLPSPLPVKGGMTITTIADARAYILTLPPRQAENQRWQRAVEMMLEGAGVEAIWSALRLALFHDAKLDLERMDDGRR